MSDEEIPVDESQIDQDDQMESENDSAPQLLTAEYKDGQLQIVEVTSFERDKNRSILPDMISSGGEGEQKLMQVLDSNKQLVSLDLLNLNLTLVKCEDGLESYHLVSNTDSDANGESSDTVTCVLQTSDGEEHDSQNSYVMVEGEQGPLMFLQPSSSPPPNVEEPPNKIAKKALTPTEILEKAKAIQKVKKAVLSSQGIRIGKRGRRRAGDLPPPHIMLSSPHFKLYLYSCKQCPFKCNAIKELAAHKAAEHNTGSGGKYKSHPASGRGYFPNTLQCSRCPHKASSHLQLMKHVQSEHFDTEDATLMTIASNKISLDSKEVKEADVLVCGACGFESSHRNTFRDHIVIEHGATTV